jgi:hypothetical protein
MTWKGTEHPLRRPTLLVKAGSSAVAFRANVPYLEAGAAMDWTRLRLLLSTK